MNVATLAQAARQSLARGLEALQARDAPPALIDVARAVARAIGALVDVELSPATPSVESVEAVLDALRDGLRLLQDPAYSDHPAAARGMKAVAEAIGVVLTLARSTRERASAPLEAVLPQPVLPQPVLPQPVLPQPVLPQPVLPEPPPPPSHVVSTRPALRSLSSDRAAAEPAGITRALNALMGPAQTLIRVEPPSARSEPERVPAVPEPPRAIEARRETPSRSPVAIRRDVVLERDLRAVDAPLGAHSPSNFYSGLAGGDVVMSGGLFVATYRVPRVGEKVLLKISMPGGYEFVAKAQVAWTRDVATSLNPGSPRGISGAPGFGARFCEITEEGRRLIQRYVRNREPLFHEDGA